MSRIFIVLGILIAAVAFFVLIATKGGAPDKTNPEGLPANEVREKILRLAIDTEPKTLDPIGITDTISDGVARKVHNCLVRLVKENSELVVKPDLAEKFEISSDGKIYTFTLRKGVKFHNGREVKASDAVYSLSRLLTAESKRPDWLKPMVTGSDEYYKNGKGPLGIKETGDYTLSIELTAPFAPFILHLTTVNCAIIPREAVEDTRLPFARNPVGVGAFRITEWKDNQVLTFSRNEEYHRGRPKLDAIKFFIVKESTTRMEKFFGGELDAAGDLPAGRVREAVKRAGPEDSLAYSTARTNYIGFGMPNGKFTAKEDLKPLGTSKLIRQAINYAIDRDYLCETVLEGRGVPAKGVLPPGFPGYNADRPGWTKDIAKARTLMNDAGFPGGKGLPTITCFHRNDATTRQIAQTLAEDLDKIGIKIDLQAREWNNFLEMVELEPRPMFILGWVADYPDPDNFLYVLFHSGQWGPPGNHTWYSNPEVDRLTEQARNLTDMKPRIPLYQRAEDIILDDSPWICTYHVRNVVLLKKTVKGIRENVTPLDTGTEFPLVDFAFVDIEQ